MDQAAGQAFSVLSGVVGRARRWNRADRPAKPPCCAPAVVFFSAADRPVVPLSFKLNVDVRRQGFWDRWLPELREDLAHQVIAIMRRICGEASAAFRWSFV